MSDVFISHDTADKDLVLQLAQQLEAAGISTWYYERDAVPGVPHTSQTGNAIASAQATLLVVSFSSIRSYEVNTEVNWTYSEHKSFVPVLVGITWAQFAHEKKAWQQLIGLSAGIEATPDNLPMVVAKLVQGLRQLELVAAARQSPDGLPVDSPPLKTHAEQRASAPRHNLPLQNTKFFGREAEIEQVKQRLAGHRLVTLTGSGGVGKTRLSLQAAKAVLADFPDGVWLVELAPLTDPALIPQQIAAVLGVRDDPGRPIFEGLTAHLSDRQLLLVLDNCEHLLEACARLADTLLRACPRLKILASSRELLGSAGEAIFHVPSLPFPDPDHLPPIAELDVYTALRLFVDRARLLVPDYQIEPHNVAALARICQRLDGVPLAIELAAARINVLTADQLAGRLDDTFRLLTGGSRGALPRQKTLRATIDWSFQLLNEAERLLLLRLSVFAGGCTLEAAEAVCAGEGLEADQVLDVLASLVAKSMVAADREPGERLRYRLFETVRQYGEEKLHGAGQSTRLRTRHRDYFLAYAETTEPQTPARRILERKLEADFDNLRLALEWSFGDLSQPEAGPRLLLAMHQLWPSHQEALDWYQRGVALCQSPVDISPRLHVKLLEQASNYLALNDPPTALTWSEQAVAISRRLGPEEKETLMWAVFSLAMRYIRDIDDVARAVAPLAEAEAVMQTLTPDHVAPDAWLRVRGAFALAKAEQSIKQGRYQDAKMHASEGIRLYDEGGGLGVGGGHLILGIGCLHLGEYDEARDHFLVVLSRGGPDAYALRWLAALEIGQGNLDRALEYCHASLREADKMPDRNIEASCLGLSAMIFAKQGQPARAARLSGAAQALYAKQRRKPWEDSSLDTLLPGWRDVPNSAAITAGFETGQAMNSEQAMAYGLRSDAS